MIKTKIIVFLIFIFAFNTLKSQEVANDSYTVFYYPNGIKSSEGVMLSGKPDGYWRSYYENGKLKSEGNRLYFELDSLWKFYADDGHVVSEINYKNGKKHGYTINYKYYYTADSLKKYYLYSKELYLDGLREGQSFFYTSSGKLEYIYNFVNDQLQGTAKEFNADSIVITLLNYHKSCLVERIPINRIDDSGLKQGLWVDFYSNGNKKREYTYKKGQKTGAYREYNSLGHLVKDNLKIPLDTSSTNISAASISINTEIKKIYHSDGYMQFEGAYIGDKPVGIHKEYDKQANIILCREYSNQGLLLSEGLFDNKGLRTGVWKFYDNLHQYYYGEGTYNNGLKEGSWKYYYPDLSLELEGFYEQDLPEHQWKWYYQNKTLRRDETYIGGKLEGNYFEYDTLGEVLVKGSYYDGLEVGEWYYKVGNISIKANYKAGEMSGEWRYYYLATNKLRFIGSYKQGVAHGVHKYFYPNGNIEQYCEYRMGRKHKEFKRYNEDGSIYMIFTYRNDELIKIDGKKIKKK